MFVWTPFPLHEVIHIVLAAAIIITTKVYITAENKSTITILQDQVGDQLNALLLGFAKLAPSKRDELLLALQPSGELNVLYD